MLSLKRRLSFRKRRASNSGTTGSVSDAEDRVVMLCEEIPSESSLDSGNGSQSLGACSSGDSCAGDADNGTGLSSSRLSPQLSLRIADGNTESVSLPSPGDHYAVRSTLHVKELYRSAFLNLLLLYLYNRV